MFIQLFSCFKRYQALKKGKIFRFEALDHFLEKQESVEECVFTGVFSLPEIGGSSLGGTEERRDFHPNLQLIPPTFSMSQTHPQAFMPYVQAHHQGSSFAYNPASLFQNSASMIGFNTYQECPSCGKTVRAAEMFPDYSNQNMPICKDCSSRRMYARESPYYPPPRNKLRKGEPKSCANCKTTHTTLWRKFKGKDELRDKYKDKKDNPVDENAACYKGKTGCNACCLYWSLHGKHRPLDMKRDHQPSRRKRKKEAKPQSFFSDVKADYALSRYGPAYMGQIPSQYAQLGLGANLSCVKSDESSQFSIHPTALA